ncbi:MAG TPA: CHASE2 domain-containing protein [Thermoanaerobaculia bacterium]|nr:CHASE2 domain-containing protein [Thermoanaerobaculia bacterium]
MSERDTKSFRALIVGAGACHWLIVAILTLGGLVIAELPLLPRVRDRVYMWLQWEVYRPEKRVIVVAIDDAEFWHGDPAGAKPLNRRYLADLLRRIATADPDVLALDVGLLSLATNPDAIEIPKHLDDTRVLLATIDGIAARCPVVLPKTIANARAPFHPLHDVYDTFPFSQKENVTYGHTSAAEDIRQIPTRVPLDNKELLDSFALAVFRATTRDEVPPAYDDPAHAWPYASFLPSEAFAPRSNGAAPVALLTPQAIRTATPPQLRKWLRGHIVLVGGVWHDAPPPASDRYVDGRLTPRGWMPGVITHANYVQSLLWRPMFPLGEGWRIGIEILLSLGISVIFLRAHGWKRARLIAITIAGVIVLTWFFRTAIGVFFDLVIPVTFLGIHVLAEELDEQVQFVPRRPIPHGRRILTISLAAAATLLGVTVVIQERARIHHQLATGQRLQVAELTPTSVSPMGPGASGREIRVAVTPPAPIGDDRVVSQSAHEARVDRLPRDQSVPEAERVATFPRERKEQKRDAAPSPQSNHFASTGAVDMAWPPGLSVHRRTGAPFTLRAPQESAGSGNCGATARSITLREPQQLAPFTDRTFLPSLCVPSLADVLSDRTRDGNFMVRPALPDFGNLLWSYAEQARFPSMPEQAFAGYAAFRGQSPRDNLGSWVGAVGTATTPLPGDTRSDASHPMLSSSDEEHTAYASSSAQSRSTAEETALSRERSLAAKKKMVTPQAWSSQHDDEKKKARSGAVEKFAPAPLASSTVFQTWTRTDDPCASVRPVALDRLAQQLPNQARIALQVRATNATLVATLPQAAFDAQQMLTSAGSEAVHPLFTALAANRCLHVKITVQYSMGDGDAARARAVERGRALEDRLVAAGVPAGRIDHGYVMVVTATAESDATTVTLAVANSHAARQN